MDTYGIRIYNEGTKKPTIILILDHTNFLKNRE
jgi:hypothetical protein